MSPMPTVARLAHRAQNADNFSRANGALTGNGWVAFTGGSPPSANIASNVIVGSVGGAASGNLRAGTFRNDQWAQATVINTSLTAGDYMGLMLRTSPPGTTGYMFIYFNNSGTYQLAIYKMVVGSSNAQVGAFNLSGPLATGTVLKFTVEGYRLRGWQNGSVVVEVGDFSTKSGGVPGIEMWGTSGQFDAFSCGSTVKVPTAFGTAGTFYSTPNLASTEAGGIQDWNFDNTNNRQAGHSPAPQNSGGGALRILPPPSPAAVPHNFLIIAPVQAGFHDTTYGNGMDAISATGLHNTWNLTLVEVCWGNNGWLGDHPTDVTQKNESFLNADLIPWLRSSQFASGGEQFWLIGFSRSGQGGMGMMFKHPYSFQKGAFWEWPFDQWDFNSEGAGGTSGPFGTQDNFNQNYVPSYQFFEELMSPFLVNTRLWHGGYNTFLADCNDFRTMAAAKGIQCTLGTLVNSSSHNWAPSPTGAWVANAVNALGAMSLPAPTNSVAPTISGTVSVGSTLTCSTGTWSDPTCQFAYQWQTDAATGSYQVVSTGANGNQYTIQSGDAGAHIRCIVTAISINGGTNTATTAAVNPAGSPVNTVAPAITGTASVGSVLTCSQGTWLGSPSSYGYQWQRNGTNIAGQTANTYTVVTADAGTTVGCVVTATNSFGSRSATATIAIPPGPPVNSVLPAISGSTSVGSALTCSNGTWTNSPSSYTFQWTRDGTNISGATSSGYTIVTADQSHTLACVVTATNVAGSASATATGVPIPASPVNTVLPAITGSTSVGSVLTCSQGTWTGTPTSYGYQWRNDGTALSGATASTYTIQSTDQGHTLTCTVTASNAQGSTPATSSGIAIPAVTLPQLNLTSIATDNFTRANSSSLGSGWGNFSNGSLQISSNVAQSFYNGAFIGNYRTDTYSSDHCSSITVGPVSASGSDTIGPITRYQASGAAAGQYYCALVNGSAGSSYGGISLWICHGGMSFSQLSSNVVTLGPATSLAPGATNTVRLVSEGSRHTIYVGGIPVLSIWDNTLTGGVPGICALGNPPTATAFTGYNAATGAVSAALQTDNFNRANNGASVGQSGWAIMTGFPAGDPPIVSNEIEIPSGGSGARGALVRTETYNNDQWASLQIGSIQFAASEQGFLGVMTRVNSALNSGYLAIIGATSGYFYGIYRMDSGVANLLLAIDAFGTAGSGAPGDTTGTPLTLVSVGTRHSIRMGTQELLSVTDSTYTSGKPGIHLYPPFSSTVTADNFACGNV